MLRSLFGDLLAAKRLADAPVAVGPSASPSMDADPSPATLLAESFAQVRRDVLGDDGRLQVLEDQELVVRGSTAQAMRHHLATVERRDDVRMITLVDPSTPADSRLDSPPGWATRLVHALATATAQPLQRLRICDQASQRSLVALERTVVPRRGDTTLKLYHVDVPPVQGERAPDDDSDLTPYVLMEASDMAVLFVSASLSHAELDEHLSRLSLAVQGMTWRCPTLVFFRSDDAKVDGSTLRQRVDEVDWPSDVHVVLLESPAVAPANPPQAPNPSAVWNALLGAWDRHDLSQLPAVHVDRLEALEESRAIGRQLRQLMDTAGISACAVADLQTGLLVAGESHAPGIDLTQAAAALAPVLRAQRDAARPMGAIEPLEEVVLTAGSDQFVLRPLQRRSHLFLMARLNRAMSNLTLARLKVAEAQRHLD